MSIPNIPPLSHPQSPQHPPPPPQSYDLDLTIISAKHLKNVNWRTGNLKPYAIFWVDPDNKLTTKSDDSGHTKPVWNQKFTLPLPPSSPLDSTLSLEIFHSKSTDTSKPFVGSVFIRFSDLPELNNPTLIRSFDVLRPSGRPQGKLKLKLSVTLKERQHFPDYQNAPGSGGYYYSSAPPYPYGPRPGFGNPYSGGYFSGYYPPPPVPTMMQRRESEVAMPSAPLEYGGQRRGLGVGMGVGGVAGALGGLALDDDGRVGERVEDRLSSAGGRDDYSDYRGAADY